jgi:two-component system, OmpR family, sensor kinase
MFRSIRAQLTAGLALLIALCLVGFAIYLYVAITHVLTDEQNEVPRLQAQQLAATYDFPKPGDKDLKADMEQNQQRVDTSIGGEDVAAGVWAEVFDTRGHLLTSSSNLGSRRLPLPAPAATLVHAAPRLSTEAVPGWAGALRVYSLPARQGGHLVGVVVVAASLHEVLATMRVLLGPLVAGGLGILLLAVLGGGVLVRRGLRPLEEMASVAEGITARRLDRRLALRAPPREVGRLAATFNAMLERLHAAFAAQRRFVADASHELRTPLATIRGRSEVLLLSPTLDAETRDGLVLIRDEAGRMGRLVANLLLLARGDEARTIARRPVELDVLLLEVARQARVLAQGVSVTLSHEDQALVLGDADLLKQLLLNLVDNALTYTPPGGRVDLALYVADGSARLAVQDTGPGIAPDELTRIFERFYRPDRARSRRSGGTGLGLAIARWIAEAHGGRIEVESAVGQGSTFTVVLPLANPPFTGP